MNDPTPTNPGVRFPPPLLFVAGLVVAWALDRYVVAIPLPRGADALRTVLGGALVTAGVALAAWGGLTFQRARTAIIPHKSASTIVTHGPYRYTRNPMYTGMTTAYLGGAALLNSGWALVALPFVLLALVRMVIHREERYLSSAFGAEYARYCARVRRWG